MSARARPGGYLAEYYDEDRWSYNYLKQTLGIVQVPDVQSATRWDIHDDYHYEALGGRAGSEAGAR